MTRRGDHTERFESFLGRTAYDGLDRREREAIRALTLAARLTFQEFRRLVETSRDLVLWGERGLAERLEGRVDDATARPAARRLLGEIEDDVARLRREPTIYKDSRASAPPRRERKPVVTIGTDKKIHGMCPVASEETVCCQLRTIDVVERCVFGCSYCAVQTFYDEDIVIDGDFATKLDAIDVEPGRFYRFGTGQASDSLAWGNRSGILDGLFRFAERHPNVLLELKTKSDNVAHLCEHDVPSNVVCSWSLNTPTIIEHEEHFTASLDRRLAAARRVTDRGMKVGFHFHPMVRYQGWRDDYPRLAARVMDLFGPDEVLFVSLGSVTLIKPVIRKLRELGNPTRIHQAELVPDPHGKLTYTDDVKVAMFTRMLEAFRPWEERVFFYLCMEKASIWERTFGRAYESNDAFEADFGAHTMPRLGRAAPPASRGR